MKTNERIKMKRLRGSKQVGLKGLIIKKLVFSF